MLDLDETIVAIASAPGGAAEGIVRLSGPDVARCVEHVFQPRETTDWRRLAAITRPTAMSGSIRLDGVHGVLPAELYLWPAGRSYTGGPVAELHTIGSPPLLEAVVRQCRAAGARLAEPGEFTLRAFLAGRIDLTQAEAVLGVIDAIDAEQLDVALAQLAGGLAKPLDRLRDALLDLLGHLEAGFDFADEDLPFITPGELREQLAAATRAADAIARQLQCRDRSGETIRVALTGWPNVGKSSLFNALARRAGAIVSHEPGTTRDYVTAEIDLDGVRCQLIDTAGVETDAAAPGADVRRQVQEAAARETRRARVRLFCLDATRPMTEAERSRLAATSPGERLVVLTKVDAAAPGERPPVAIATSSVTGEGIELLRRRLREVVLASGPFGGAVAGTAQRCRDSLRAAVESLRRASQLVESLAGEELVAAEIRLGLDELGRVVGRVYADDVLDRVFSRFCIGK